MSDVFDFNLVKAHALRAAAQKNPPDFLTKHLARGLNDRVLDIRRDFGDVLEIANMGDIVDDTLKSKKNITTIQRLSPFDHKSEIWPLNDASLELILSSGHLHWTNDLVGALIQFRRALKPDGVFIGALFGGETLHELRASIAAMEILLCGGVSPRVSPFVTLPDMAGLMQRAQFALPVVDNERINVTYPNLKALIADIRGMGQSNAVEKRSNRVLPRHFWDAVENYYRENFSDSNKRLNATVEIIYMIGWAPSTTQQKPLKPGSATHRLADILRTDEIGAGDYVDGSRPSSG